MDFHIISIEFGDYETACTEIHEAFIYFKIEFKLCGGSKFDFVVNPSRFTLVV